MVTGHFPVDVYVKDVDASNAAPETDNLKKTHLWRIGHSYRTVHFELTDIVTMDASVHLIALPELDGF
jgi:hypothetical protein